MKKNVIVLIISLFIVKASQAQHFFGLLIEGKQMVSGGVNANPNLNFNAGYLLAFESEQSRVERLGIISQANFPLFSQKGFDFDLGIGGGTLLNVTKRFKTLAGLSWNFSRTADLNGRYYHSGFKIDLLPGYYRSKWVFAPHVTLNYQPWINIKHSDYVKQAFHDLYPNGNGQYHAPKDGWFYQNNITFQTGIGIVYYQPKWYLGLTTGFQHQPNRIGLISLPDIGIMPFYGEFVFGHSIFEKK